VIGNKRGARRGAAVAAGLLVTLGVAACGDDDFANEPRPPVPVAITGVITEQQVDISPNEFGAGPVVLTISNQTPESHRVTLEGTADDGTEISEVTGPINPQDTATVQQTLPEGDYEVLANSDGSIVSGIAPGEITVGPPRSSASDELELP
jgi:hypothetical protein